MVLAGPFKEWKIISRERQKSLFTLTYDYDLNGGNIHEVKEITIELGKRLFRSHSTFTKGGQPAAGLEVAVGITPTAAKPKPALTQAKGGWPAGKPSTKKGAAPA